MKATESIGLLTAFLVAGTALGVFFPTPVQALPWAAGGVMHLLAGGTILLLTKRSRALHLPVLFFLLGLLCAWTETLCGAVSIPTYFEHLLDGAALHFRAAIDALPFSDARTAPLLKALLTGDRSGLSRETVAMFRASGASHLLALSGLHIGILYLLLSRGLVILGNSLTARRFRATIIILSASFYTLLTGASPSLVRAFLFILIRETALLSGRKAPPLRVFALALTIQLVLCPSVVRSVGFQLSYSAMLGIFLLYPPLEKAWPEEAENTPVARWSERHSPLRLIWNSAALSIACQAFTAPLAWLYFKTFPRYFLLTNLLAIPLTSFLVPSALLTLASHMALPDTALDGIMLFITDRLAALLQDTLGIIASM